MIVFHSSATADAKRSMIIVGKRGLVLLSILSVAGCAHAIRTDAAQLAKLGATTSDQISALYRAGQQDLTDTYELNQFYSAWADIKAPTSLTKPDLSLLSTIDSTNRVLASRVRLANALKQVYASYGQLAEYDHPAAMGQSIGSLLNATIGAAGLIFPADAVATFPVAKSSALLKAAAKDIGVVQQNKSLIESGNRLVPLLTDLRALLVIEMPLLSHPPVGTVGQDTSAYSGISQDRLQAYKRVLQELVTSEAVISRPLLNRFLSGSDLSWPEPTVPFHDPRLKSGIKRLIEIDAYHRSIAANIAGEEVLKSLDKMIELHRSLPAKQKLLLEDALAQSAIAQFWVDILREHDVPAEGVIEALKQAKKEGGGQ